MKTIGMSESIINDVMHVLAGILMIGNIEFVSTGGAQVRNKSGELQTPVCAEKLLRTFSSNVEFMAMDVCLSSKFLNKRFTWVQNGNYCRGGSFRPLRICR